MNMADRPDPYPDDDSDPVMLAEWFLADRGIWPLGANKKASRAVRMFAAWLNSRKDAA